MRRDDGWSEFIANLFNFEHSLIQTWQILTVVMWVDDDANTHVILHMHKQTYPDLTEPLTAIHI
jgi:hypothetical protein